MKRLLVLCVVLGMASQVHAGEFVDDFDSYDTPLTFTHGNYGILDGNGGWTTADVPGASDDIWMNEGWGYPGTADNNGCYFVDGGAYNGIAHSIPGTMSAGDQIGWTFSISHPSAFLDMAIGTGLADGGSGNDVKFHVEMGGAGGNFVYYRAYDTAGVSQMNPDPFVHTNHDAGYMGHHVEALITMGAGLDSLNLQVRNLSKKYNPGTGELDQGPADWVNVGDYSTGGIANSGLWIAFTGQAGNSGGPSGPWSRTVMFDNINITPEPATMVLLAMGSLALLRRRKK